MSRNNNDNNDYHYNFDEFDLNVCSDQDNETTQNYNATPESTRSIFRQPFNTTPPFQNRSFNLDFSSPIEFVHPSNSVFSSYLPQTQVPPQHPPVVNLSSQFEDTFHGFSTQTSHTYHNPTVNLDTEVGGEHENVSHTTSAPIVQGSRAAFSIEEDQALISSFMRISEDKVIGTGQDRDNLWGRVLELYNLARMANSRLRPRTIGMLDNRFRRISSIVLKWAGCYRTADSRRSSGMNEDDVITEARKLYEPPKFNLLHAWDMLKGYKKWMVAVQKYGSAASKVGLVIESSDADSNSSGKRVRDEDANYSSPISTESRSTFIQRPEGTKAAKRNKGKKKVNEAVNDEYEQVRKTFQRIDQMSISDIDLEREKLELKKKNTELAMQQLQYKREREQRKRRDEEREQRKTDWDMLQNLLQIPSLPAELEEMKSDLLKKISKSH